MSASCPELNGIAEQGCGEKVCQRWVCTDHITSPNGELIHIAGANDCICGVQSAEGWFLEFGTAHSRSLRWADVLKILENDIRFTAPPTDEEVEAAAERVLRLLEEMTHGS